MLHRGSSMSNISDAPMEQTKYVKGFKYELDPTKEQSIALNKIFGCTRKVYNEILGIVNAESQYIYGGGKNLHISRDIQ